jgi:MFS family permease
VYGRVSRYLDLLRAPGVAPLIAAVTVGRLPYGMNLLALILLLRSEGFGYAEVGIVTGTAGLAVGVAAPVVGRLVDRLGQTRVLVTTALVCICADVSLTLAALSGAGLVSLTALAFVGGAATPPVSPAMRTLWPGLVGRDRLDTAFAFDALQLEVVFIVGPLLAAALAALISPEVAFLTGVTMQASGALAFAAAPASRRWRPAAGSGTSRAGALSVPGMRTLFAALTIGAVGIGALEIAIPAFAEGEARRSDSGWLFALWGVGSLAGGLWYGARHWRIAADRRFLVVSAALAVCMAPLPLAGSMAVFAALLVVAGLALAPSTAAGYSLVGELAPEHAMTEAYAWQIVAYVGGSAVGAWVAGALVEAAGVEAALACCPAAMAAGLVVALTGRRSLAPRPPVSPRVRGQTR